MNPTHKIISMKRGSTSNSNSPMWRCQLEGGERVNIFKHDDPDKDNFHLFHKAGYGSALMEMKMFQELTWKSYPIEVELMFDGKWWNILAVCPRSELAEPDGLAPIQRLEDYRLWAINRANELSYLNLPIVYFDVETTGIQEDDEIFSVSIIDMEGKSLLPTDEMYFKPNDPSKMEREYKGHTASEITGISSHFLLDKPSFYQMGGWVLEALKGKIILGWNVSFDIRMLERACSKSKIMPGFLAVVDVMQLYSMYRCAWDSQYGEFRWLKLEGAAEEFGIDTQHAHSAYADCKMTLAVLNAIAESEVLGE